MEYWNINDFIEQKLNEKCDKEGISTEKVIYFLNTSISKLSMLYIKVSICY